MPPKKVKTPVKAIAPKKRGRPAASPAAPTKPSPAAPPSIRRSPRKEKPSTRKVVSAKPTPTKPTPTKVTKKTASTVTSTRKASTTSSAKKSPPKISPAKKSPAKKSPAKKSPAKKSPTKKSPVKKSPAKRSQPSRRAHPDADDADDADDDDFEDDLDMPEDEVLQSRKKSSVASARSRSKSPSKKTAGESSSFPLGSKCSATKQKLLGGFVKSERERTRITDRSKAQYAQFEAALQEQDQSEQFLVDNVGHDSIVTSSSPMKQLARTPEKPAKPGPGRPKRPIETPKANKSQEGRGNVVSWANKEYVDDADRPMKRKNPFFELMPAKEVWHRRMPPYFPFGETPYIEAVMSHQINEDLNRTHPEPAKAKQSISYFSKVREQVGSYLSPTKPDTPKERKIMIPNTWGLPEVTEDQVEEAMVALTEAPKNSKRKAGPSGLSPPKRKAARVQ